MFERFTDRARQVVMLAQDEAARHRHDRIGTEHILLGLLREGDGVAASVLKSLDITVERVRAQVMQIVGAGEAAGQLPFTPPANKVFELALREALSMGHNYIGTEHILLGLLRDHAGQAGRILLDFHADSATIRNGVIRLLGTLGGGKAAAEPASSQRGPAAAADIELPELAGSSLEQLDELIDELIDAELEISYRRRLTHVKLDILWAERENRRRQGPNTDS